MLKEKKAIIFDLDNTLIVEEEATRKAFYAACENISELKQVDLLALFQSLLLHGKKLWTDYELFDYCDDIQISFTEALCAEFQGEDPRLAALHEWGPVYRREAWLNALKDLGINNFALAVKLGERYKKERKERFYTFPGVEKTLEELKKNYKLAMITNGAPDLQREKVFKANLDRYFEVIVVSGEVGVGKPKPKIFMEALTKLGVSPQEAVMIGDSMARDIAGANGVGITSVWINHEGSIRMQGVKPDCEIRRISELLGLFKERCC
ncbi:HAD family hydrolase [Desulfitibacter alkalitolerans]|uniref:HAD family hydrolase n=1 Tax=Desulfitibacter alkalitolerans TaxID=264641 RepID=UPI000688BB1E|nr:HAD family hydrolase [Desulfitibacter alkalitolerans]